MSKPSLTLHRLDLFLAVLESGGLGRAARARNISQPAMSEHIRGLEQYFGVLLFERSGRQMAATAAGRELEPYARKVITLLQEAAQVAGGVRKLERGTLSVGASTTPGTYLVPSILGEFHAHYPRIDLKLLIDNTREIERRLSAGQLDLGIVGEAPLLTDLAADRWLRDELVVIVPRKHAFAGRRSVSVSALRDQRYIARESGSSTREVAEQFLSRSGIKLIPEMELGSTEAVREAVAAGLGIALVSRLAVKDRRVAAVRLAGGAWRRDFLVVRRAGVPLSPAAERFHAVLMDQRER